MIHDVYHVEGLKQIFLSIGKLIQKGYRVYIEDNHCVIKDKCPSNQQIENVPMTRNRFFPLRIILEMKGKKTTRATFKAESKEAVEHFDKKENDSTEFQAVFQAKVKDEY